MNNLGFNQQVFILNGQPVILQRNTNVNTSVSNVNSNNIVLRPSNLNETSTSESDINTSTHLPNVDSRENNLIHVQSSNNDVVTGNEYVAYVGDSDDEEGSTIHLTLEQAAELGLQFDNDDKLTPNDLPVSRDNDHKDLSSFTNIFNKDPVSLTNTDDNNELDSISVFSTRKIIPNSIEDEIAKGNNIMIENGFKTIDESVIEQLSIENTDQQLTLVPHFIDGAVTYSVEINSNNATTDTNNGQDSKPLLIKDNSSNNKTKIVNSNLTTIKDQTVPIQNNCVVVTSMNSNSDYTRNNTIKTFTTCSDLTSFVDSSNQVTTGIVPISATRIIETPSQNVITTNNTNNVMNNITFSSLGIITGDSANKVMPTNNFTSLSDLLKCSNNVGNTTTNNSVAMNSKTNYNILTNYQPISLTQLVNNITTTNTNVTSAKKQDKIFSTSTVTIPTTSLLNNSNNNSNLIKSNNASKIAIYKNSVGNTVQSNQNGNNSLLINTSLSNTVGTNCNNEQTILVPVATINKHKTLLPTTKAAVTNNNTVLPTVVNSNDSIIINNQSKSSISTSHITNLLTVTGANNQIKPLIANVSNNNIQYSSLIMSTACNDTSGTGNQPLVSTAIANDSINSTSGTSLTNLIEASSKNSIANINNAASIITADPRLLNGNSESNKNENGSKKNHIGQHLLSSTPAIITTTSTCTATTTTVATTNISISSAKCSPISTVTNVVSAPPVKSIKTAANNCILPKEISAALNKLPLLNDTNKPLGSSENPIQLVQQGHTFHSTQALTDDQLKQITTVLQQNNLSSNVSAKNVLYDAETNTKIIYRVVYPEEFDLKEASASGDENGTGKGRKRGRPSLKSHMKDASNNQDENTNAKRKQPLPRTRSGRLSRPPRYMVRDYKRIRRSELDDSDGAYSDYQSDHEEENTAGEKNLLPGLLLPQKRNISSTFRCPTCNKIYLGYRRMAHHFDKYSDHGTEEYLLRLKKACENKQIPLNANSNLKENPNGIVNNNSNGAIRNNLVTTTANLYNAIPQLNMNSQPLPNVSTAAPTNLGVPSDVMTATATTNVVTTTVDNLNPSLTDNTQDIGIHGSSVTMENDSANATNIQPITLNLNNVGVGSGGGGGGLRGVGVGYGRKRGRKKIGRLMTTTGGGPVGLNTLPPSSQQEQELMNCDSDQLQSEQNRARELRELLEICDASELVQIAGPAVCSVLSTWELLLLRVDSKCSKQNRVTTLCNEIKALLNRFKELAGSLFQPVDNVIKNNGSSNNGSCITFEMEDKMVSHVFGVPCGLYKIDESVLKTDEIINSTSWRTKTPMVLTNETGNISTVSGNSKNDIDNNDSNTSSLMINEHNKESDLSAQCSDTNMRNDNHGIHNNISHVGNNDTNLTTNTPQFLLTSDSTGSILCDDERNNDVVDNGASGGLDTDSVDQIVNEQLKNLTSVAAQSQDLSKAEVDELMKNFTVLEQHHHHHHHHSRSILSHHQNNLVRLRPDQDLDPTEDDLMDSFTSITNQRTHVSASTEDLIKSLENFSTELHNSACDDTSRQGFINGNVNFNDDRVVGGVNNVNLSDALDFDVLSQDFHHATTTNVNQR